MVPFFLGGGGVYLDAMDRSQIFIQCVLHKKYFKKLNEVITIYYS